MKQPVILVLALAFAGALCFFVWRALWTDRPAPLVREATAPVELETRAHDIDRLATPERTSSKRLDANSMATHALDTSVPKSRLRALRVRIAYASGIDEHAEGIDARAANRTGFVQDLTQVGPDSYGAYEMIPGPYVISVSASGYQRSVVRGELSPTAPETVIDVVLKPIRVVQVRWRTSTGAPIAEALSRADIEMSRARLAVYASIAPIVEDGPPPERVALTSITMDYGLARDDDGRRIVQRRSMNTDSPVQRAANAPEDTFGSLVINEPGPLWVSAYWAGVLIDAQPLELAQDEIVFTSRIEDMAVAQGTVSMNVYDAVQETPIAGVVILCTESGPKNLGITSGFLVDNGFGKPMGEISAGELAQEVMTDEHGRLELKLRPGWTTLSLKAEGYASTVSRIRVVSGQKLDLGMIGLHREDGFVGFNIIDSEGKAVTGVPFELVRLSSYDGTDVPYDRVTSSSGNGIVSFAHVARERYVLRCSAENMDCTPLIVEARDITSDPARVVAQVTVRTPRWVSFVFDPPLPPGSLLMIETLDGLPARTLETTEFGVVAAWLGGTDYTLHLVEHGRATSSVRFKVDTDPFVLDVSR